MIRLIGWKALKYLGPIVVKVVIVKVLDSAIDKFKSRKKKKK